MSIYLDLMINNIFVIAFAIIMIALAITMIIIHASYLNLLKNMLLFIKRLCKQNKLMKSFQSKIKVYLLL